MVAELHALLAMELRATELRATDLRSGCAAAEGSEPGKMGAGRTGCAAAEGSEPEPGKMGGEIRLDDEALSIILEGNASEAEEELRSSMGGIRPLSQAEEELRSSMGGIRPLSPEVSRPGAGGMICESLRSKGSTAVVRSSASYLRLRPESILKLRSDRRFGARFLVLRPPTRLASFMITDTL